MNWICSGIFYVTMLAYYYLVGETIYILMKKSDKDTLSKIIFGFITVYFLCFIIGVPSQILGISWFSYFSILSVVHIIVILGLIVYRFHSIIEIFISVKSNWKLVLINHIKEFWFIYLLVFSFSFLSLTNLLAYYQQNYDDTYYINKVVQAVGSLSIGSENSFNGSTINYASGDIIRVFNTYELTYAYFGTMFRIDLTFFCRATMVIHNYFIVFATYTILARKFIEKRLAQYALVPFSFFLIAYGYLAEHGIPILGIVRSYDLWQFQTAMFYGGSLVRSMALPLLIILILPLFKKIRWSDIVIFIIASSVMLSFSTIFIQQAILIVLVSILIKSVYSFSFLKLKSKILPILGVIFVLCSLVGIIILNDYMCSMDKLYSSAMTAYFPYYDYYANADAIIPYSLIIIVVTILLYRKREIILIGSIMLCVYIILILPISNAIMNMTSFSFVFVSMRTIASFQYVILFFIGLCMVKIFSYNKLSYYFGLLYAILFHLMICMYICLNYMEIIDYDYQGSGISGLGYSTEVLLNNDKMMPDIFVEIGEYFDELEYSNYRLYAPGVMNYNNAELHTAGLVFTSNRIETCSYEGCDNISVEEKHILNNFTSIQEVLEVLAYRDIKYMIVTNKENMDLLVENGGILEKEFTSKIGEQYYLVKAPE